MPTNYVTPQTTLAVIDLYDAQRATALQKALDDLKRRTAERNAQHTLVASTATGQAAVKTPAS